MGSSIRNSHLDNQSASTTHPSSLSTQRIPSSSSSAALHSIGTPLSGSTSNSPSATPSPASPSSGSGTPAHGTFVPLPLTAATGHFAMRSSSSTPIVYPALSSVRAALTDTPLPSVANSPRALQPSDPNINLPPYLDLPRRATTLDVPGLTSSRVSPNGTISQRDVGSKLVIVMVGLPARGKSYITKKLARYLNWLQHDTKIFNVGNTRRQSNHRVGPASHPLPDSPLLKPADVEAALEDARTANSGNQHDELSTSHPASFFSPENRAMATLRESWAMQTLDELLDWILIGNGSIGILDATNSTIKRRAFILNRVKERSNGELKVLFLESICNDKELLEQNLRLKLSGPDYRGQDPDVALADFRLRVKNYEKTYETIGDEEEKVEGFQYVKMINVGRKVVAYNIQGFLAGQAVYFLLNFNLAERQIWITRHGESEDNVKGKLGGDASLSPKGIKYAKALTRFIEHEKQAFRRRQLEQHAEDAASNNKRPQISQPTTPTGEPVERHFCVWTSMLKRSIETARWFDEYKYDIKQMRMLNELGSGDYDGLTYAQIREQHPAEYAARMADKISYRFPGLGGENYLDVINRLRPVITEVERMHDHVLIIGHRVVSRVLLSYFMNLGRHAIGDLEVPLNTLWVLEPKPYGVYWAVYQYDEERDWFFKVENSDNHHHARHSIASRHPRQYQHQHHATSAGASTRRGAAADLPSRVSELSLDAIEPAGRKPVYDGDASPPPERRAEDLSNTLEQDSIAMPPPAIPIARITIEEADL
ncbi:PFK26 6-phosphofructo-2-kinase-like protein [Lipomyces oligophaga]|uniref:PFK26 6-phosphofructo-2-kinase-like protein n=1 Tax=Lipomyces oligophaga TaxID=45792 RepID=UPI0034CFFF51